MKIFKLFGVVLIAAMMITFGSEIGEKLSVPGAQYLVPVDTNPEGALRLTGISKNFVILKTKSE